MNDRSFSKWLVLCRTILPTKAWPLATHRKSPPQKDKRKWLRHPFLSQALLVPHGPVENLDSASGYMYLPKNIHRLVSTFYGKAQTRRGTYYCHILIEKGKNKRTKTITPLHKGQLHIKQVTRNTKDIAQNKTNYMCMDTWSWQR